MLFHSFFIVIISVTTGFSIFFDKDVFASNLVQEIETEEVFLKLKTCA